MEKFLSRAESFISALNNFIWSSPLIVLMALVGILMSVGTGFFQISHLTHWLKNTVGTLFSKEKTTSGKEDDKTLSAFQTLCTALASTIGTGNIVGTATALASGGAGAVFWMWVAAFFGMMTAYSENVLGIFYRQKGIDGEWHGGPMYYISEGIGEKRFGRNISRSLSVIFCISCIFASFGMGNMAQGNSISNALSSNFNISRTLCAIVLGVVSSFVIFGGTKALGRTAEKIVPLMAFFYIGISLLVFVMNSRQIPYVFKSIFSNAFSIRSLFGGALGVSMKKIITVGFKRGIFSNEAGLGSSVIVHSASSVKEPVHQGMWGIFVVFFDTIIVCTLTAFVILSSQVPVMSLEDALKDIGKTPRYFYINDDVKNGLVPLVDCEENYVFSAKNNEATDLPLYRVKSENGSEFYIRPGKDKEKTYTNIMSVRAITATENGEEIKNKNAPPNSVIFEKVEGVSLVTYAFSQKFGSWAGKIIAIATLLFAFTTIIGWSFYGLRAWQYLFPYSKSTVYKTVFALCTFLGPLLDMELVWKISDMFNGLMAFPNLVALIFLSPKVFSLTRDYIQKTKRHTK